MIEEIIKEIKDNMDKSIESLDKRFTTVRAGRANPSTLDGVMAEYYGVPTPLKQLATISVPEARQLLIKPFDKSCLSAIEKAIFESNLGYTPNNDGESIRIVIPMIAEEAKVSIRNIRHEGIDNIKQEELPEDEEKKAESRIQDLVNEYNKKIDNMLKDKEQELLTV